MKLAKIVYAVLICLLLSAALFLLPFSKGTSAEKRPLSEFPEMFAQGKVNMEFFSELDTWLAEHFPFRSAIISTNNLLKATLFGSSDEDQVIVGKNGWLYFSQTLPDYFGENVMTEAQLRQIVTTLSLMEEQVTQSGGKFVFTVAPNKNTIYPQYMPSYYRPSQTATNLDRLTALLREESYFADLQGALSGSSEQLYHARDSHWNNLGALIAWREMVAVAGRNDALFHTAQYTWNQNWRGDLEDMIFPSFSFLDWQADYAVDWTYQITSNYRSEEDIQITTENSSGQGRLLMMRDSFGNALLPYFAQIYEYALFSRAVPYDLREIESYDTVIIEIVERNLSNLLRTAPVMLAPVRQLQGTQAQAIVYARQTKGLVHLYGSFSGDADHVYLQLSNGEDTLVVEAFPILEKSLLEDKSEAPLESGFSAYVPAEYKDYQVTVLIDREE